MRPVKFVTEQLRRQTDHTKTLNRSQNGLKPNSSLILQSHLVLCPATYIPGGGRSLQTARVMSNTVLLQAYRITSENIMTNFRWCRIYAGIRRIAERSHRRHTTLHTISFRRRRHSSGRTDRRRVHLHKIIGT